MLAQLTTQVEPSTLGQVFAFILAMAAIASPILLAYMAVQQARAAAGQKLAASKVDAVAEKLEIREVATTQVLAKIEETGEKTHTLSNSAMGLQLEALALVSRELANSSQTPAHIAAAEAAERRFAEHQKKQAIVDAQAGSAKPPADQPIQVEIVAPIPSGSAAAAKLFHHESMPGDDDSPEKHYPPEPETETP